MIYFICYLIGVVLAYLIFVFFISIDMSKEGVSFDAALSKTSLSIGGIIALCIFWPIVLAVVVVMLIIVGAATLCEKIFTTFTERLATCMKNGLK